MSQQVRFQLREDTSENWIAANPQLLAGEPGFELDTNKLKIGDGSTYWNSLPYLGVGSTPTRFYSQGIWTSGTVYTLNSIAFSLIDNNTYICLVSSLTNTVDDPSLNPTEWGLFATNSLVGATGATGDTGPTGNSGPTGATFSFSPQGPWVSGNSYVINSLVVSPVDNNTYICIVDPLTDLASDPSANLTEWQLFLTSGATGPTGDMGPTGATGQLIRYTAYGPWINGTLYALDSLVISPLDKNTYVCTAASLVDQTSDPSANLTEWQLFIVAGQDGVTGATGDTGAQGDTGPKGDTGEKGDTGSPADVPTWYQYPAIGNVNMNRYSLISKDSLNITLSGNAYFFDGSTGFLNVSRRLSDFRLNVNWTVEWWEYLNDPSTSVMPVLCQAPSSGGVDFYHESGAIYMANGDLHFTEPTPGYWNHIAVVNNNGTITAYVNGESQT